MYPSIHSLAHRAPPATRTRVRWQPYSSLPTTASASSFSSRSPSSTYLNTPASSVSSSPSPNPSHICDSERVKLPQQKDLTQSREKNKYALSLVDQAVKSLCEIWHPQDIPVVFLTSSRAMVPGTTTDNTPLHNSSLSSIASHPSSTQLRNKQLPSPISPTTQPSPPNSSPAPSAPQCNESLEALLNPRNTVPIKGFVHEVLRRSRTSGSVLQTALCYLEAIRGKVPELIRQEKAGEGLKGEPELDSRITPATEAELELEAQSSASSSCGSGLPTLIVNDVGDVMHTVKVSCSDEDDSIVSANANAYGIGEIITQSSVEDDTLKKPKASSSSLAPLPPLPSPLLCPRRAFLAALILASKFTQDKCYSNRAWAKLSGLPPREIGRCERALGDALDWRLWVGKSLAPNSPATSASTPLAMSNTSSTPSAAGTSNMRPVARCQSESNLRSSASERSAFLVTEKAGHQRTVTRPLVARSGSGLRRASTLPADAFASSSSSASLLHTANGSYLSSRSRSNNVVAQWISGQSHAGQMDQEMYSPEVEKLENETPVNNSASTTMHVTCLSSSPCPPTPGLSYSPSTTESSLESGDRTIQMSAFASFEDAVGASGSFGSVGSLNAHLGGVGYGVSGITHWTGSSSPIGVSLVAHHNPDFTYASQKLEQHMCFSGYPGREIGFANTAVGTLV